MVQVHIFSRRESDVGSMLMANDSDPFNVILVPLPYTYISASAVRTADLPTPTIQPGSSLIVPSSHYTLLTTTFLTQVHT